MEKVMLDRELRALAKMVAVLESLTSDEIARVMAYLKDRYISAPDQEG